MGADGRQTLNGSSEGVGELLRVPSTKMNREVPFCFMVCATCWNVLSAFCRFARSTNTAFDSNMNWPKKLVSPNQSTHTKDRQHCVPHPKFKKVMSLTVSI